MRSRWSIVGFVVCGIVVAAVALRAVADPTYLCTANHACEQWFPPSCWGQCGVECSGDNLYAIYNPSYALFSPGPCNTYQSVWIDCYYSVPCQPSLPQAQQSCQLEVDGNRYCRWATQSDWCQYCGNFDPMTVIQILSYTCSNCGGS